jgi:protein-S-isoprenylcysteine O-methyltransferase Ste14
MRRVRTHDPTAYLLALAGIAFVAGFGLLAVEQTGFGEHVHRWHHFWWLVGVFVVGVGIALTITSIVAFVREMKDVEVEATSESSIASPQSTGPGGEIEEEIVRKFRSPAGKRRSQWLPGGRRRS